MKSKKSMIAAAIAVSGLTLTLNALAAHTSVLPATHRQGEVSYLSADRDGKVIQRQIEIAANGHQRAVFEWQS